MAIDNPVSDLARVKTHEADHSWPHSVKISISWCDASGKITESYETISSDRFFGTAGYNAPLQGAELIGIIERLKREGPPKVKRGIHARRSKP